MFIIATSTAANCDVKIRTVVLYMAINHSEQLQCDGRPDMVSEIPGRHTLRTSMLFQSNEAQNRALKLTVQHTGRVRCLRMGLKGNSHTGHGGA